MKDRAILVGDAAGYVTKCSGDSESKNKSSDTSQSVRGKECEDVFFLAFFFVFGKRFSKIYRQTKSTFISSTQKYANLPKLDPFPPSPPGEGIYFAAKSGRMCAKTIIKNSKQGARMIDEVS